MLRNLFTVILAALSVAIFAPKASAQFENQRNFAGVHIGLSGVGSALALGLDYERGVTNVGDVGPGIIGIGGLFDYYSYGSNYNYGGQWTYVDIGVSGMYHFVLKDRKWDPFIGLVLGYEAASWTWDSGYHGYITSPTAGGFTLGASAGVRYFFSRNWAAQARIGFGFYILALGVDYSF